jgi:hypothetical protein
MPRRHHCVPYLVLIILTTAIMCTCQSSHREVNSIVLFNNLMKRGGVSEAGSPDVQQCQQVLHGHNFSICRRGKSMHTH